jgi:hypothetical protein
MYTFPGTPKVAEQFAVSRAWRVGEPEAIVSKLRMAYNMISRGGGAGSEKTDLREHDLDYKQWECDMHDS